MKKTYMKSFDLRVSTVEQFSVNDELLDFKITQIDKVVKVAKMLELAERTSEVLILLTLNKRNNVTGVFEVHKGTIDMSITHPRDIFSRALLQNASSIILMHNHPSGDVNPSKQDMIVTTKLVECGVLLGIDLLDHVIIGKDYEYCSIMNRI